MNLQNLFTTTGVCQINRYLAVESSWARQGLIQNIRSVGAGNHDYSAQLIETVHLYEKLVERLILVSRCRIVAAATLATQCVNLVYEDDAGR